MPKFERENSKEKILKTAIKLFADKGFDGTSVREICKSAKVNISMISYFWGGKKELYDGIIDNLVEKQTSFFYEIINSIDNTTPKTKDEKIKLLKLVLNKVIDLFYSNVTNDFIIFIIKAQQNRIILPNTPAFKFLKSLVASILGLDENDKLVIFKMTFLLSQVNSPRILTSLTLNQLNQDEFLEDDIKIIKDNLNMYIDAMVKDSENA